MTARKMQDSQLFDRRLIQSTSDMVREVTSTVHVPFGQPFPSRKFSTVSILLARDSFYPNPF